MADNMDHGYEISVLHVDDEVDIGALTTEFLERENERISVQTATSAAEGLKQLSGSEFDCVVSDYSMPGENGIEFLETVREEYPDLPFILYTGKGSEAVASQAISAGVSDYLQKETGTEQYELLANEIAEFVEKYRTEHELDQLRRQFTKVVEQNFVGIYIIQDGEFTYANPRMADIHGYETPEELIGKSPLELVAPAERERVQSNLEQRMSGEMAEMQYQTVGQTKTGNFIDIELHGSFIELDGEPAVIGALADITEQKEERRKLEFLESLEKTLTDLSINFLKAENRDIDALIDGGLEKIGRLVAADRSYVFLIDHEADTLSNTHEWCAAGVEPQIDMLQDVDLATFPWLLPQLRNNESVTIPDVADLPPEAEDLQQILAEQNIASLVVAPMISAETLVGFIGFDWLQEQQSWSPELINILRMAGKLITSAQRQEARRRELERHEAYLEHSQDIITEVEEDGTIRYTNPAAEEVLGINSEERLGDGIFEYIHPDDRQRIITQFEEFVTQEAASTPRIEYRREDSDGSYRWLESIGVDQTDTTVGGYVIYSRDITRRKEGEEKYRNLFEESRDPLMVFDRDGYLDCNEQALEMFGIDSVDEFLDYTPWELSPPTQPDGRDSEEAAKEHLETAFQEGTDFFEWTHQRSDGTEFPSEVKLSRFSYSDETVILALIRDITERKKQGRELAAAREASEKLIEASPVPIWVQKVEKILYSNDAAAAFFGYEDTEALVGTSALSFVPEDERERARKRNEEMLETGESMDELSGKVVTTDDTYRDAVFAAAPITYYGNEAIVTIANDVTERKEQKEQLRKEKERLDEFASLVSHDLRNPLNVAQGRITLAQNECDSEHLDTVADGIERSLELISDLLTLARGGQEIGELKPVAVSELARDCWETAETADATIETEIESTIRADKNRLRQVFENLFRNAVEHGGEEVTISIGQLPDGFSVEDAGPGIPAAEREDVFEPGYSERRGGTGLGLSIVKQIVDAHGWDVQIADGSDGGVRFEITGVEVIDE